MNQREKIMAIAILCLLGVWGGRALYGRYTAAVDRGKVALEAARDQRFKAEMALRQGDRAMQQLEVWQQMSLPPNRDVARSLYRAWLLQKAKDAGLKVDDINPNERTTASTAYKSIGYSIEAKGTLAAVTKFLYEFYHSAQLHQITKLNMISAPGAPELNVSLQVEALILPGATHQDSLPDGQTDRLKLASAEEYEKQITGRDLFKVYTPPRPPRETRVARTPPRPPPEFDHAAQAKVTGIVGAKAGLEAWIRVFTTGEVLRVHEGDDLEVGDLKGKIESIQPMLIIVKTADDKQLRIPLGRPLREREEPAAEAETAEKPAAEKSDT